jgi:hypothetical protein
VGHSHKPAGQVNQVHAAGGSQEELEGRDHDGSEDQVSKGDRLANEVGALGEDAVENGKDLLNGSNSLGMRGLIKGSIAKDGVKPLREQSKELGISEEEPLSMVGALPNGNLAR